MIIVQTTEWFILHKKGIKSPRSLGVGSKLKKQVDYFTVFQ